MANIMNISIREETSHKLRLDKNPEFLRILKNAVAQFCGYEYPIATSALFDLLYEDDKYVQNKVLQRLHFTLYAEASFNPHNSLFFIEEDSVLPIAEELQFQYIAAYPDFLKVMDYPNCQTELENLKNKLKKHPLLLYRAVESILRTHQEEEKIQSCISLLLSEKDSSQSKGLEKLGHNRKHQQLLLPYANEIGLFLKAMDNAYKEEQQQLTLTAQKNQEAVAVSPEKNLVMAAQEELNAAFAPLANILKVPAEAAPTPDAKPATKKSPAPDSEPAFEQPCSTPVKHTLIKDYSVSPELSKFLDNKVALCLNIPNAGEFWEFMAKLRSLSIDLNLLVDNLQYLLAVLDAHENLEKATDSLIQADENYDSATAKFSKDDIHSLHALFTAGNAFEEAKVIYNSAYESFVEHRDAFEDAVVKA